MCACRLWTLQWGCFIFCGPSLGLFCSFWFFIGPVLSFSFLLMGLSCLLRILELAYLSYILIGPILSVIVFWLGRFLSFIGLLWPYFVCYWPLLGLFYCNSGGPNLSFVIIFCGLFCRFCGLHGPNLSFMGLYWAYFVIYWPLLGLFCRLWYCVGPILSFMWLHWAILSFTVFSVVFLSFVGIWLGLFCLYVGLIGPILSFIGHHWAYCVLHWAYFVDYGIPLGLFCRL